MGICALLTGGTATSRYLVLERSRQNGPLSESDVKLMGALAARARDRIGNIELVRQNQLLNVNASLGVFAE